MSLKKLEDLEGLSLAEVLELLEKGKIGHRAAMDWLHIDSLEKLVEIMHFNDRQMPGHRPMNIPKRTMDLLLSITRTPTAARKGVKPA